MIKIIVILIIIGLVYRVVKSSANNSKNDYYVGDGSTEQAPARTIKGVNTSRFQTEGMEKNVWEKKKLRIATTRGSMTVVDLFGNESRNVGIMAGETPTSVSNPVIGNFYESNYACPDCGLPMHKTVFPVGMEYPIKVMHTNTKAYMKRVFTCTKCRNFFSAAGEYLSDGEVYELRTNDFTEYRELFKDMNRMGTTQGRSD